MLSISTIWQEFSMIMMEQIFVVTTVYFETMESNPFVIQSYIYYTRRGLMRKSSTAGPLSDHTKSFATIASEGA